ncbi:hypothetical protein SLS60_001350 [Paraconiothyrium brasiliense]|uniref:DUF7025 domain-containing protein n=1 Tax=Paraconiothyrium brasiliense TaxID=300254 RepID=A0ABR3S8U3_9PLEO
MAHVSPSDPRSDDDKPVTMSEDGKEQKSAPSVDPGLTEEVEALKRTVSALLAERGQGSGGVPQEPSPDPNVLAEIERFQRMEACLYKHRKEWEANVGPGDWDFEIGYSKDPKQRPRFIYAGLQAWITCNMALRPERNYERPDIFDPALLRDVDIAKDSSEGGVAKDYYDTTIDWGNRRDRLRKTFEWELDRMFLREELQMKKLEQQKSDEGKKRRERRMAEADTQSGEEPKGDAALSGSQGSLDVGIAWSEWYRFKNLRQSDSKVVNIIDVLDGEPIVDDEGGADRFWSRSADRRVKETGNPSTGQKTRNSMDPAASPVPERIRVCSGPLLRTLVELLGPEGRPLLELEDMKVVFTRPYKVLSYREQDLRGWCDFLERQFEGSSSGGKALAATEESVASAYGRSNNTEVEEQDIKVATDKTNQYSINGQTNDSETSEQETHPTESLDDRAGHLQSETEHIEMDGHEDSDNSLPRSVTAFRHLKTLLEFMDSSVAAKRNYLNSPQCRKVFFSDLWQLFRPGSEVIGSDGKQAYRVIGVRSAKHRVAPLWERWYRPSGRGRSKKSDFSITCVYIDFDGSNIGPVQKEFDIERFDGQREVTSLEVYPLRFHPIRRWEYGEKQWQELESHPISERYRKRLINRGWAFLDVVRGKHMYYAGSTLDGKEEVESPVVVDFETAITTRDARLKPPDALAHRRGIGYENDEMHYSR